MAGADDLPREIWELIVAYLPSYELRNLILVNRQLFHIVLDEKYRVVSWEDWINVRKLERLSDPAIASHVRCLHIRAWSLNQLFGTQPAPMEGFGSLPRAHKPKRKFKISKALSRFHRLFSRDSDRVPVQDEVSKHDKEALDLMITTMGFMTNIKALIIEWKNLPINAVTLSLLRNVPSFHPFNVCILTLTSNLNKLRSLLPLLHAPHLEELNLNLEWEDTHGAHHRLLAKENEGVLVDVLAPYIKARASTLCSLRIVSQALGDHSSFFSALSTLSHLSLLVLEIPFSKDRLRNPQCLVDFLRSNAFSLKHLEVMAQPEWDTGRETETQSNLAKFFEKLIRMDPWLPNVRSFWITGPPVLSNKGLTESLLNCLPPTVTAVRLANRYYTASQLTSIVSIISSRVTVLHYLVIDVEKVPPPEVLKEMSIKLPGLWSLTFIIQKDVETALLYKSYGFGTQIDWNLYDLGVYYKTYRRKENFLQGSLDPEKYRPGRKVYGSSPVAYGRERREYSIAHSIGEVIWKGKDGKGGIKSFNGRGDTMDIYWS